MHLLDSEQLAKIIQINKIYIAYPRFQRILFEIQRIQEESHATRTPRCMLITGETGVGKSSLIAQYIKMNPSGKSIDGRVMPVLKIEVPLPATISALITAMLEALSADFANTGTLSKRRSNLVSLMTGCGVKLVIIDEFQHLVERGSDIKIGNVADWIKSLINETNIPIVLVGVPTAMAVLEHSPQLARRFPMRREIKPFDFVREPSEFMKLLEHFDEQLPFARISGLADPDLAPRLFLASKGVFGHLAFLIQEASRFCLLAGSARLEKVHFVDAYALYGAPLAKGGENPFKISAEQVLSRIAKLRSK
ncbi:TniB family NTP-binding protein [Amantichitinum ursilacus]|uniref:Bacterial TniB protein n=1 Tax=Amantichitinum ursilacus TaxID=857265 RepID=A0A0N0GN61_9NEIS|nr:TniB family NTP-binding protein [Amantichitinum ursilacus]KPC52282.1 Bacterial TniB protein [Amantichitinum ursilacus]